MTTASCAESLEVRKEIHIQATPDRTFAALLEQLGPLNEGPDGTTMALKLEAWPGGRWYRDLDNETGHFWGHVQVIKPPSILEIVGPMFMSYPVASHIQWKLTDADGGTDLAFVHRAFGMIQEDHRTGVNQGWQHLLDSAKSRAEG